MQITYNHLYTNTNTNTSQIWYSISDLSLAESWISGCISRFYFSQLLVRQILYKHKTNTIYNQAITIQIYHKYERLIELYLMIKYFSSAMRCNAKTLQMHNKCKENRYNTTQSKYTQSKYNANTIRTHNLLLVSSGCWRHNSFQNIKWK